MVETMEKRIRVPVLATSTIGNCTMALTLDTTHKSTSGQYHLCLRFSMNGKRYHYRLGEKYSSSEFDVICKADGRGRGGNINPSYTKRQELSALYNKYEKLIMDVSDRGKLKSVANIEILFTGQADKRLKIDNPVKETFLSVWREVQKHCKNSELELRILIILVFYSFYGLFSLNFMEKVSENGPKL